VAGNLRCRSQTSDQHNNHCESGKDGFLLRPCMTRQRMGYRVIGVKQSDGGRAQRIWPNASTSPTLARFIGFPSTGLTGA
jgi:hypothetical protein